MKPVPSGSDGTVRGRVVSGYYMMVYRSAVRRFLTAAYPIFFKQQHNVHISLAKQIPAMTDLLTREPEPLIEWMLGLKELRRAALNVGKKGKVTAEWTDEYFL